MIQQSILMFSLVCLLVQPCSAQTSLVSTGSVWKYLDDGSDQGNAWRALLFDDSTWVSGAAQLGYGDGDETTIVNGGPPTNRFITTYFRQQFNVSDPSMFTNLVVRLLRDDGGIVYLNGTEVFRSNMPLGPVDYLSLAASVVPNGPQESEYYSTTVASSLLLAGQNLLAVEIHQANATSSDLSFDLELLPNIVPRPPDVSITNPPPSEPGLVAPASVMVEVAATDFDGTVAQVSVYLDNTLAGISTVEPFAVIITNLASGDYILSAVATDSSGLSATSAPVALSIASPPYSATLIAAGSVWKYLDNGSTNEGTAWKEVVFDDSRWSSGPAVLGYGGANKNPPRPEATVINPGCCGISGPKYITDYFRHQFRAYNAAGLTNLYFRVLRDDGVVVYLNGTEIFRMNMPDGPITWFTTSSSIVGGANEIFRFPTNVSPTALVEGLNLLAVELHQSSTSTPDAAFDLELDGIGPPSSAPIVLSIQYTGSQVVLSWTTDGMVLQGANNIAGPWATIANSSPYSAEPSGTSSFYRLERP